MAKQGQTVEQQEAEFMAHATEWDFYRAVLAGDVAEIGRLNAILFGHKVAK